MALTLDSTLSATTSNSYCTVQFADDYWANHYSTTKQAQWQSLTDGQKQQLLINSCRIIESCKFTVNILPTDYSLHYDYRTQKVLDITLSRDPVKYYYYQKLQFPRNLDIDPVTHSTYIPSPIMEAQCEQAVYVLNFDESAISNRLQGVVSDTVEIGRSQIHLNQEYVSDGSALAPMALEFLKPFTIRGGKLRRA